MSFVIPRAGGRLLELPTTLSSGHIRFRVHIWIEFESNLELNQLNVSTYIYLISNSLQFHACAAIRKCPHGSHTHTHPHTCTWTHIRQLMHTHTLEHIVLYTGPKSQILLVLLESLLSHVLRCYTFHMAHAMRVCARVCVRVCTMCLCDVCASEVRTNTHTHSHIHHAHYKRASGAGIF